ncbi:LacI family DNA-binding transcriptional regulator [Cohaesibacter celericrescens]|uniref:HTH lacI-type domain-containing protein n=1 Tax=Cohaesibacter celericrescens TaxID=2067669 RepID=A0A2N5XS06_9HYPH|nr:LacI family DNA-binding transcriptional regulator [Cohaesibacter celericrescens]PLW77274.1 hypothetical protein C0081_07945 [Cohaesibacter celericrescens]
MDKKSQTTPTLKDVAAAAGLSVAAVSKVFNNRGGVSAANRALVAKIAEELGYSGISGRGAAATGRIRSAVVATMDRYVSNDAFYGQIIDAILQNARAEKIDIDLAIFTPRDIAHRDFSRLLSSAADAIFLVGLDDTAVIDAVRSIGRPAVLVNGMDTHMNLSSVSPDNYFGGRDVTRRLLELGHTEILHVTHLYRESLKRRMMGFREAMEDAGLDFSKQRHICDVGSPDQLSMACCDVVAGFLKNSNPRPTAIFCANDMVALGVIRAITTIGLTVPNDISVVGFDGLTLGAHASPPLSTMEIDGPEMAYQAVQLLLEQAQNEPKSARRLSLGVRFIDRETTAPHPSKTL